MHRWAQWLSETSLSLYLQKQTWAIVVSQSIHIVCVAAFGSILMLDLRLLGISSRHSPVSALSAEVLPYTWAAFACALFTGGLMFLSKAQTYVHNLQFQLKFACMELAGIDMAFFTSVPSSTCSSGIARCRPRAPHAPPAHRRSCCGWGSSSWAAG
jgi:hypothetical protein